MKTGGFVYALPDGDPLAGVTVRLVDRAGSTVATAGTDSDGMWTAAAPGFNGPYWARVAGRGLVRAADVGGNNQAGPFSAAELPVVLSALPDGVYASAGSGLAVSAVGPASRQVTVAAGMALVRGYPVRLWESETLTLDATGSGRIDTVVLRVTPWTQAAAGRSLLAVVEGAESGSPAAPSLTQTAATWEFPLADVTVGAGGVEAVADRRVFAFEARAEDAAANPTVVAAGRASTELNLATHWASGGVGALAADSGVTCSLGPLAAGVTYDLHAAYSCAQYLEGGVSNTIDALPAPATAADWGCQVRVAGASTVTGALAQAPPLPYDAIEGGGHVGYTVYPGGAAFAAAGTVVGDGGSATVSALLSRYAASAPTTRLAGRCLRAVAIPRTRT